MDRPIEMACRPDASGARSCRAVSAPRTITASRSSAASFRVEVADEAVERAQLAVMLKRLGAGDVVWRCAGLFGDLKDLLRWNVEKLGVRLDETPDQPWAGDAVNLGVFAGDPLHDSLPCSKGGTLHLYI